jgi:hypothetical protein
MSMPPGLPWLRVMADWAGGALGAWTSAAKLGLGAMENFDPSLIEKALRKSATALCEFSPRSFIDTRVLSVKQFRDAASPERACHQALISSKLETLAFRGAGILGEAAVMAGDMSGDYRVRVSRDPELELVDRLGLVRHRAQALERGPLAFELDRQGPVDLALASLVRVIPEAVVTVAVIRPSGVVNDRI